MSRDIVYKLKLKIACYYDSRLKVKSRKKPCIELIRELDKVPVMN